MEFGEKKNTIFAVTSNEPYFYRISKYFSKSPKLFFFPPTLKAEADIVFRYPKTLLSSFYVFWLPRKRLYNSPSHTLQLLLLFLSSISDNAGVKREERKPDYILIWGEKKKTFLFF